MTATKTAIAARFAKFVELLDAAELGPADYSYSALKWRLQRPAAKQFDLKRSLIEAFRTALFNPLPIPAALPQGSILAASSYVISANLLREIMAKLDPGVGTLCDASEARSLSLTRRIAVAPQSLAALGPALIFALRARSTLKRAGAATVDGDRIALAAFIHRMYRPVARTILDETRPKCLVVGNGNRPLEFALWAEAKARNIFTVLLPYAEINLKPERFLSLCRGNFDLALPFSEYSAAELRKLRPDIACEVVGFPSGLTQDGVEATGSRGSKGGSVLYLAGTNFEEAAAAFLKEAFGSSDGLRLRVRLHPRNKGPEVRQLFDWLSDECITDPTQTALATDIASSDAVIAIRSTAALNAMVAGRPLVWLSPQSCRAELERNPIRRQGIALFDAATPAEVRALLGRALGDETERKRVVEEQWSRLHAAGYGRDYFDRVISALLRVVGLKAPQRQPTADGGLPSAPIEKMGVNEGSLKA